MKLNPLALLVLIVTPSLVHADQGRCLGLYREYRHQQALKMGLVPVIGVPTTAVLTAGAVSAGAHYGTSLAAGSVAQGAANGFGYALVAGGSVFYVAAGAVIYLEASAITHFKRASTMVKVIEQAKSIAKGESPENRRAFDRLVGRLKKRVPSEDRSELEIAEEIVRLEASNALCDGSLKSRTPRNLKLKNNLANPRELLSALDVR
jgi:hypothetical protein